MTEDNTHTDTPFDLPQSATIGRRDDAQFQHDIKRLIDNAEKKRLRYMKQHQQCKMIGMTVGLTAVILGLSGFGWFIIMSPDIARAVACLAVAGIIPLLLYGWAHKPVSVYLKDYKENYMPMVADLIGGFSYHPARGISESVLKRTGVVPAYAHYSAEDCFRGLYKGTKVLFSEATLKDENKRIVFKGIFVFLELPHTVFEGHTVITADRNMAEEYAEKRWRKLSAIPLSFDNPLWNRFVAYSDKPDDNALIIGDKLIKEMTEADIAFGDAMLSAVLFKGKYVFMMIPHAEDMFEASDLYIPISTHNHALACKKEIEQLLEVVDVFDIYASKS